MALNAGIMTDMRGILTVVTPCASLVFGWLRIAGSRLKSQTWASQGNLPAEPGTMLSYWAGAMDARCCPPCHAGITRKVGATASRGRKSLDV
jgi:hypothetical protein